MKYIFVSAFLLLSINSFAASGWRQARGNETQDSHSVAAAILHSLQRSSCDDKSDFIRAITQVVLGNHSRVMIKEDRLALSGTSTSVQRRRFQVTLNGGRTFYYSFPDDIGESITVYLTDGQDFDSDPDGACKFTFRAYRD